MIERPTPLEDGLARRLYQQRVRLREINTVFETHPNVNVQYFDPNEKLQSIPLTKKVVKMAAECVFDYYAQLVDIGDKEVADFIMKADI